MGSKIKNVIFVVTFAVTTLAMSADIIPLASDLSSDMRQAGKQNIPVLVEFSLPGCDYCAVLEKEVLQPMLLSGEYNNKVIVRKLEVSDDNSIVDFSGNKLSGSEFAARYNISIFPTLVFFDASGNEVGERLVGLILLDFYFAELDSALQKARQAM